MTNRTFDRDGETLSVPIEASADLNWEGRPVRRTIRRISDPVDREPDGRNRGRTAVTGDPSRTPDVVPTAVRHCASVSVRGPDLGFNMEAIRVPNSEVETRGSGLDSKGGANPKAGGSWTGRAARGARDKAISAHADGDMADPAGNRRAVRTPISGILGRTALIWNVKTGARTLKPLANDQRLAD